MSGCSEAALHVVHDSDDKVVGLSVGGAGKLTNWYAPGFGLKGCDLVLGFIRCKYNFVIFLRVWERRKERKERKRMCKLLVNAFSMSNNPSKNKIAFSE